jgi:acetyltransferase-like isoleucine patch superfamily enzyme
MPEKNFKSFHLRKDRHFLYGYLTRRWTRFWMSFAGLNTSGRLATRLAAWFAPPHKARTRLAYMNQRGYIEPSATIYHSDLRLGVNCFIGDRVMIFQRENGGPVNLGDRVCIYRDTIMETGYGGSLIIGSNTGIHPRCQLNAYVGSIRIGRGVDIAPNCAFYPYDHGLAPDRPIREQPLKSKGDIIIEDDAWLGVGAIVLSGVRIGKGSVIGAGSVVTSEIPDGAIAVGSPAQVVKMRSEIT